MRVLITGAAGNLGSSLCRAFLREGFDVRVLLHRKRLKGLGANLEVVWGDVTHLDSVRGAMEGVDAVVHLAAIIPPLTEKNPELATRVNVGGTQTVVDLIKEKGERIPFVFTSSAGVFGPTPDATEPLHPDRNPLNPTTVYLKTKVQAEDLIKESGIDYLILRLTSSPYSLLSIIRLKRAGIKYHMFSIPLKNRLEFCHLDDVALAILNAVKNFDMVKCNTLMIGGGPSQQMRYEDMLRAVLGTFGLPLPPRHKFAKEPYALDWYDTSRSQELLKFQQKTLDDYTRDLARQFPAPLLALMRYFIGPVFGRLIVRLM